jgi:hypothetical protein
MPDIRTHRGPHPADARLFAPEAVRRVRAALGDYCLLLSKGYAEKSSLKLVGDRFALTKRQRLAVMRSGCSDTQRLDRLGRRLPLAASAARGPAVDGYNLLITLEAALGGGYIFRGRDGCLRDLASLHGTYRKVEETIPAVALIGGFLAENGISRALLLLDRPVSNSGRLKALMAAAAERNGWKWDIRLSDSPDAVLKKTGLAVASSDSAILDACGGWVNLAGAIVEAKVPSAKIVDLAV